MKYDFTTVYDRRGKDAVAIDEADHFYHNGAVLQEGFDQIPMWIADMNFATAPSIPQAMIERAKNPLYGYFPPRDEYYKSIIRWQLERNHVEGLTREKIGYEERCAWRSWLCDACTLLHGRQGADQFPDIRRIRKPPE